jgi:putative transposase
MKTYQLSDESWTRLAPYLPEYKPSSKGGRPRLDLKKVFEGILFIKGNHLQWRETPKEYGAKTTLNDYFRQWKEHGLFKRIHQEKLFLVCGQAELHTIDLEDDLPSGGTK